MNKWIPATVLIAVVAGVSVSLAIERHAWTRAREQQEMSRQQSDRLTELSLENQRLSNLVSRINSAQSLSRDQLRELLKLRNEVGQLRQTTVEKEQLQAKNTQLQAVVAASEKQLAEAQAAPNYWPKDQLTFAGYADPESTVRSLLWAMKNGADYSTWKSVCTPETCARMEKEWDKDGKSEAERTAEMKAMGDALLSPSSGFHVLDQKFTAPDQAVVSLSFDGEGKARKFVLRKIGNEWKFQDLIVAGQRDL